MARRISAIGLTTPVEVSLWTTMTALIACSPSSLRRCSITAGSTASRQSPGSNATSSPSLSATPRHSVANWPLSNASTRSPGDRVLTSAASHAPVPDDGYMTTFPAVPNSVFSRSRISSVSAANSGPRWSMVGRSIALSTRSGTLDGPGIWRKCRPDLGALAVGMAVHSRLRRNRHYASRLPCRNCHA